MRIKKLLAGFLAVMMICAMLTACGGGDQKPVSNQGGTASSTPNGGSSSASGSSTSSDSDAYSKAVSAYITSFEALMGQLGQLLGASSSISSDEELVQWCKSFMTVKDTVGKSADTLAGIAKDVPDEYKESHAKLTVATAAVYDAMTGFESSVDAAINGDQEAFTSGIGEFVGNMTAAEKLWNEAVQR